ncbi:rhamnosyl/mannosyltransferase [Chishuiella changwenlii]|uniref:Glycosyl transferase family 1 n=1 Tax=Chishuiella changwenlii TaxID=1434701 RepID=A0A1M7A4Z8_9FLAO|nr:glycosyltransferase [Chishuiella changwenlii]GGE91576.1 glycosyl transferase family 1 [Chishuiella changwenlii]SHL37812.1 rhamnosyl/mannosyltransferase [Chishuiella changwenlii]
MKILQFGKAYPPANLGGVEVVIQLLMEGLNDNEVLCDTLGVNDKRIYKEDKYKNGTIFRCKLVLKKFSTLFSFQVVRKLNKIKDNYDIIHVHSPDPMAAIALFLIKPKKPIVLHWHSDILKQKLLLFFYKPLLKWLMKKSEVIIATSPNYIEGSKLLNLFVEKCKVVPIGIDTHKRTEENNRFLSFENKKIIFSLGRLAYYKGFQYLIEAGIDLPDDVNIVIAGEGDEQKKLEAIIEKHKLKNKVFLIGKINETEKDFFFRIAKIFVLSSIFKTEAYAIVQVEALSYGIPIISTQIHGSGVDWVNVNGITGITVPIMDSKSISNAINNILYDEELYNTYSKNSLERYREFLTRDKMIKETISIYKNILSQ